MSDDIVVQNDQLVLISGESGSGKSMSLKDIPDQPSWIYFNAEAGKRLPFKNNFHRVNLTDPYELHNYMEDCIANSDKVSGVALDTITFLMDMFESQYVIGSANTMQGWSQYAQFFKHFMQNQVPRFKKPVLVLGHTLKVHNESTSSFDVSVPIKGALKNQGLEAYFSTVVSAKKVPLTELEKYKNDMLTITPDDEIVGFKHVFQTRLTKATVGERIRSPFGMFDVSQTYINNDAAMLLKHLADYYA